MKSCASLQELAQLQSSQHALEQTLNQTKSKLTQEIQQAKKDHNMLEAEMEKVQNSSLVLSDAIFLSCFSVLLFSGERGLQPPQTFCCHLPLALPLLHSILFIT